MAKIVYNGCYGGFGVSEAGMSRYAEIKGIALYPEHDKRFSSLGVVTYWIVPPGQRPAKLEGEAWHLASFEERKAFNKAYREATLDPTKIDRSDPALAQVVEELGTAANGMFAELKIKELPSGTAYRIDEYDGNESVVTKEDDEWSIAA